MDKLMITNNLDKQIDKILSERVSELSLLDQKIAEEEKTIAEAEEMMNSATAADNLKEYRLAKSARAEALDGKEMYEARKEKLENKPLISREEYEKAVSEVREEIAILDEETKQILTALSEKMNKEAERLRDALITANNVLARWQHEVYRDADRSRHPVTGEVLQLVGEIAKVDNSFFETVNWGKSGVNSLHYKARK